MSSNTTYYVCDNADTSLADNLLGWGLTVGVIVALLPQVITLIRRKNVSGLSALSCALNYLSNMATLSNESFLQWDVFGCCSYKPFVTCIDLILPFITICPTPVLLFVIYLLYVYYAETSEVALGDSSYIKYVKLGFLFTVAATAVTVGVGFALVYTVGSQHEGFIYYAVSLGTIAAVLQIVTYAPQIWTTFHTKKSGSLSIASLAFQIPGSLLVCYFQGIVYKQSWSTWLPYLCSAFQQIILIVLCIFFHFQRVGARKSLSRSQVINRNLEEPEKEPLVYSAKE